MTACRAPSQPQADAEPEIITTVGMIADVARNVAGPCVTVTALMGPGTDPHTYKASARDSRTLGSADLILYSGFGLEATGLAERVTHMQEEGIHYRLTEAGRTRAEETLKNLGGRHD